MRELSIFVDESGDFGKYEPHAPYYIFSLVFHDQSKKIDGQLESLRAFLVSSGMSAEHCFHAGPIIRREEEYQYMDIIERRRLMNRLVLFSRKCNIQYTAFIADKKHCPDSLALTITLSKQLSSFLQNHISFFMGYDRIIVYYDNGQIELNRLLASVFVSLFPQIEFKKVLPVHYRLFQVADLFCTLELERMKHDQNILSKSETTFFGTYSDMKRNYLKILKNLQMK